MRHRRLLFSRWTGIYAGGCDFSNPYGPILFGDNVGSPDGIGGLQIGTTSNPAQPLSVLRPT
jgi:hypothetical protein